MNSSQARVVEAGLESLGVGESGGRWAHASIVGSARPGDVGRLAVLVVVILGAELGRFAVVFQSVCTGVLRALVGHGQGGQGEA